MINSINLKINYDKKRKICTFKRSWLPLLGYEKWIKYNKKQETEVYTDFDVSGCTVDIAEFYHDRHTAFFMVRLFGCMFAYPGIGRDVCNTVYYREKSEPLSSET